MKQAKAYKKRNIQMRAPYACDPSLTRGRRVVEDESTFRSPFQRDRYRIIHASAFSPAQTQDPSFCGT